MKSHSFLIDALSTVGAAVVPRPMVKRLKHFAVPSTEFAAADDPRKAGN
jgi:hypothetical protein